ncbi:MAG: RNA-guided endonuclease InsQ/TnpB family protein [Nitrososphaerales archaeon]
MSCNDQINELPELKIAFPEYKQIHSQILQDVLRRLDKAFQSFFGRVQRKRNGEQLKAGYPRFKARWRYNSFAFPQSGFKILSNGHILLSKIGTLRVFMHRKVSGDVKTLTIKRDRVGDWFVVITAELPDVKPKQIKTALGVDVGLKNLVAISSGEYIEPPQLFRKSEKRLKHFQKELSTKRLGSENRAKARIKLARAHRTIERQRTDFLHKLSRTLIDKADLFILRICKYQIWSRTMLLQNQYLTLLGIN